MATTAMNAVQDRLGDFFVREGLITEEQLQQGVREARTQGTRLGYALVKLGFVAEVELTRILARQYRVPAVDLEKIVVDPKVIQTVPAGIATKHLSLIHI